MKALLHADNPRENGVAAAVAAGAKRSGDKVEVRLGAAPPGDLAGSCNAVCLIGAKSAKEFHRYRAAGIPTVLFDKGYVRFSTVSKFWRIALNANQPVDYLADAKHSAERWKSFGVKTSDWRERRGDYVLIAGSSPKQMAWYGVLDVTAWIEDLAAQIRAVTDRPIIYRPRATWRDAKPIEGVKFWPERFELRLCMQESHVMVVSSSNACFDAVTSGLPAVVLGEAVARPISSTSIEDVERPRMASAGERRQWLSNLAWCQFTLKEFAEGIGWRQIRTMIEAAA